MWIQLRISILTNWPNQPENLMARQKRTDFQDAREDDVPGRRCGGVGSVLALSSSHTPLPFTGPWRVAAAVSPSLAQHRQMEAQMVPSQATVGRARSSQTCSAACCPGARTWILGRRPDHHRTRRRLACRRHRIALPSLFYSGRWLFKKKGT